MDKLHHSESPLGAAKIVILKTTTRTDGLGSASVEVFGMLTSLQQLNLMEFNIASNQAASIKSELD